MPLLHSYNSKFKHNIKKLFVRRKYKDSLFLRAFRDKKDLLELYNAINGTNNQNIDDLTIVTLEDAIYMSMKNDIAFIVSFTINLYEHQSTFNPNMPLRGAIYLGRLYSGYIIANQYDIYSSTLIKLPCPQCIVFYNGERNEPEEKILRLSDSFKDSPLKPDLECTVRCININFKENHKLLESCRRLHDYSFFIDKVRQFKSSGLNNNVAIDKAIDYCLDNDILTDILAKHRAEVTDMILTYFDEKLHNKTLRNEGYESRQSEIDTLNQAISDKNASIADKDAIIAKKDDIIASQNASILELQKKIAQLEADKQN
ncbi:MAG: hypothetical protein MJ133_09195 [Lachnospiraceae bacterium]|nr:hypothetical protein [Lachnospiraceae bacterium]